MPKQSTYIQEKDVQKLIKLCANELRLFLSYLANENKNSPYHQGNVKAAFKDIEEAILETAKQFVANPELFSDEQLVKRGQEFEQAVKYPVRMEVRRSAGTEGAAQIAVRGIYGEFRHTALKRFSKDSFFKKFNVRVSGNASFEINIKGIDKALPIKYLRRELLAVLDKMDYTPGSAINVRKTKTVIAADGDGTSYPSPNLTRAPMLKESSAYDAILEFLKLGGVFVIISGNNLERTKARMITSIPPEVHNRVIVVANGGANMVIFNDQHEMVEVKDYHANALKYVRVKKRKNDIDLIYLGDDGRKEGNDADAFKEAGWAQSILVAGKTENGVLKSLKKNQIGGNEIGAGKFVRAVNILSQKTKMSQPFFSVRNIAQLVKMARN